MAESKAKWNLTTFYSIILFYVIVIAFSAVYLFVWQGFGSKGLVFSIAGRDQVLNAFDIVLLLATIAAFFLVAISLLAFNRRRDNRIFVLTLAFFFFALSEMLQLFENFFPNEYIFISNAGKVLDLLILLSFAMLVYARYYRPSRHKSKPGR